MTTDNPKYLLYGRVSTQELAQKQTIEGQKEALERYVEAYGLDVIDRLYDDGVSGTIATEDRVEAQKIMQLAERKMFSVLLVTKIDRLGRSTLEVYKLMDYLNKRGIVIRTLDGVDTSTPAGRLFLSNMASFAQFELEQIRDRTSIGRDRNALNGCWPGGKPPYGYVTVARGNRKYLEVDEEEAHVVRLIFSWYVSDKWSTIKITDQLNAMGVIPAQIKRGVKKVTRGQWTPATVADIIRNPTYKGEFPYRKFTKTDKPVVMVQVPAIVEAALWNAAQQQKEINSKRVRSSRREYLLTGLLYCGKCGNRYVGSGLSGQSKTPYYRCISHTDYRLRPMKICDSKSVNAVRIENFIWDQVVRIIQDPQKVKQLIDDEMEHKEESLKPVAAELANVERAIANKTMKKEAAKRLWREDLYSDDEYREELQVISDDLARLNARRDELLELQASSVSTSEQLITAMMVLDKLRDRLSEATDKTKRAFIEALVNRVVVLAPNRVRIECVVKVDGLEDCDISSYSWRLKYAAAASVSSKT